MWVSVMVALEPTLSTDVTPSKSELSSDSFMARGGYDNLSGRKLFVLLPAVFFLLFSLSPLSRSQIHTFALSSPSPQAPQVPFSLAIKLVNSEQVRNLQTIQALQESLPAS